MKKYDDMVVGAGISGLTLALLLAINGHSVLLIEKAPHIGGSLRRFYRRGIPFDTGFHFTGGLAENGTLHDMFKVLGLLEYAAPIYFSGASPYRLKFEAEQAEFEFPSGCSHLIPRLSERFPGEERAIERYFEMMRNVCSRTPGMNLRNVAFVPEETEEEYVSLEEVLRKLTDNPVLKALLSIHVMCYGVKPAEISFANHSRTSLNLYESMVRVKGGGDALIKGFVERFRDHDVDIMCNTYVSECIDIKNKQVGRFLLNSGEEVECDRCIFTIHPKEMLKSLPRESLSKAFINRITDFESSAGFFSVFAVVEDDNSTDWPHPSMLSLFPTADLNSLFDSKDPDSMPLVILQDIEEAKGRSHHVVCALELSFAEHVEAWKDSTSGNRPAEYIKYKEKHVASIRDRVIAQYPEYRNSLRVVDAASMLTFRDYLHSPEGSAYGVKQKVGQFNVVGRLPLRNVYAAGQSSVLPGIMGAMVSSFIVGDSIIGRENYARFIEHSLGGKAC